MPILFTVTEYCPSLNLIFERSLNVYTYPSSLMLENTTLGAASEGSPSKDKLTLYVGFAANVISCVISCDAVSVLISER